MKRRKKLALAAGAGILILAAGLFAGWNFWQYQSVKQESKEQRRAAQAAKEREEEAELEQTKICVEELSVSRLSRQELELRWPDTWNSQVEIYEIERRTPGQEDWRQVGTLSPEEGAKGGELSWIDRLTEDSIQQYEYRVNAVAADPKQYEGVEGTTVLASNLLVCLDPGHYSGKNAVENGTPYAEGDFTLRLAKALARQLEQEYGVTCALTRDTGSISIGGYTDGDLDSGHISLRGEAAKGADLFVSLHTNANLEGANGCETQEQPVSINKPILILNEPACEDSRTIQTANAIGSALAKASYELGLATQETFRTVSGSGEIREWTDAYNDQTDVEGTVCKREGQNGDYYGVLRGAANVGVPGMIIEHGFHTVPQVRQMAAGEALEQAWAAADARGIAEGFGLKKEE